MYNASLLHKKCKKQMDKKTLHREKAEKMASFFGKLKIVL